MEWFANTPVGKWVILIGFVVAIVWALGNEVAGGKKDK